MTHFSNYKPPIDNLNGQTKEPYVVNNLSKFQSDSMVNETKIVILLKLLILEKYCGAQRPTPIILAPNAHSIAQ